jgi:polysaccharide export outer membrane protein
MLGDAKNADLRRSYILRNGRKLDVNFYDIFAYGDFSKDIRLKPSDVIYIPDNEMNRIYVMGEVKKPQFIYHREGIKVLDAILQAEGFTEYAKESRVIIFRDGVEKAVNVKDLMKEGDLSQNVDLEPGDYVVVKESLF